MCVTYRHTDGRRWLNKIGFVFVYNSDFGALKKPKRGKALSKSIPEKHYRAFSPRVCCVKGLRFGKYGHLLLTAYASKKKVFIFYFVKYNIGIV